MGSPGPPGIDGLDGDGDASLIVIPGDRSAPLAHKNTHQVAGSDALTAIAASILTGTLSQAQQHALTAYLNGTSDYTTDHRIAHATSPMLLLKDTALGANLKEWAIRNAGSLVIRTYNDAGVPLMDVITLTRAGDVTLGLGLLDLVGGQIRFPSTQNASADANTLDDYEEGGFTPSIGGTGGQSGQTYTVQEGWYQKVGDTVTVWVAVTLSALGTITGTAIIRGLPFTSRNSTNYRAVAPINWTNMTTAYVLVQGTLSFNTTDLTILGATAATVSMTAVGLLQADLSNTSRFITSFSYRTTG